MDRDEMDGSRLQAAEMRFLRAVKVCTRQNNIKNKNITKELGMESVMQKVIPRYYTYKECWTKE
jgi:hypothetical protein